MRAHAERRTPELNPKGRIHSSMHVLTWQLCLLGPCVAVALTRATAHLSLRVCFRPYVGDNRWCDDWDYTCTVGATVETSTEKIGAPLPGTRRSSFSKDPKKPDAKKITDSLK